MFSLGCKKKKKKSQQLRFLVKKKSTESDYEHFCIFQEIHVGALVHLKRVGIY